MPPLTDADSESFTCEMLNISASENKRLAAEDWGEQNKRGREEASRLIDLMTKTENPTLLFHAVKAMAERGIVRGVEVGFFSYLAMAVIHLRKFHGL